MLCCHYSPGGNKSYFQWEKLTKVGDVDDIVEKLILVKNKKIPN